MLASKLVMGCVAVGLCIAATADSRAGENANVRENSPIQSATLRREASELSQATKRALRDSHTAKSAKERNVAARQLVQVFIELRDDQKLAISERANLYRQVRSRLVAIEQGIRSAVNRGFASRKSFAGDTSSGNAADESKLAVPNEINIADRPRILGQQLPPPVPANGRQPLVNNGPGDGQQPNDFGQELLDLIQKVIRSSTWDINGGPSSAYYYQPLQALVITAPSEVHEDIGSMLGGLRK